jgi:hypothetical protein
LDEGILSLITGGGGKGIRTGDIIHVAERLGMASVPTFEIRSLQHIRSFLDDGSQHLLAILGPRAEGHAVRIVDVLDDGFLKIYAPAIGFYEQAADALFSRNVTGEFVKVFS